MLSVLWMNTWNMQGCGYFITMAKRKFIYLRPTGWFGILIIVWKQLALITDEQIKTGIKRYLNIQLNDNVKARWLNNELSNEYVNTG